MKRSLPDLRNLRQGIEPTRLKRDPQAVKPVGLRVVNDAGDPTVTELWLYEEIGMWGIGAQDVIDALAEVTTPTVRVRINSPGGDVFDGIAIMNALSSYTGTVTGVVDSLCASIATAIAMACESLTMSPGSQMMIHPASGICFGDAADMQKMADLLHFQTSNIAGLYAGRAGGTSGEWLARMQAETWYTADEAVAAGLADDTGVVKQSGQSVVPAGVPSWDDLWDLSVYRFAGRAKAPAPQTDPKPVGAREVITVDELMTKLRANTALEFSIVAKQPCTCGPKGYRMVNADGQHTAECPALGQLTPRPVNLPAPAGVNWEVVSNGDACEPICEPLIDGNPYAEDDLPDIPAHPNCDCELQVAYGVDNKTSSPPLVAEAEFDPELFRSIIREAVA